MTPKVLATWHEVLETEAVPVDQTRMLYTVNRSVAHVLSVLAESAPVRDVNLHFSAGWNEKTDRRRAGSFSSGARRSTGAR